MDPWFRVAFLIAILLFIYMIFHFYWMIQLRYNPNLFSLYTPDNFYIDPSHKRAFQQRVKTGSQIAKNSSIIIASLVRDVEHNIRHLMSKVEQIGAHFRDYRLLIVENDSQDKTREKLLEWSRRNNRVIVLGCGYNAPVCKLNLPRTVGHSVDKSRISKMVYLRNIYIQEIQRNYSNFDYTFMWDLDIIGMTYLDGIFHSLAVMNEQPNVNVICANGVYRWPIGTIFYDTYAISENEDTFHIDTKAFHDIAKSLNFKYFLGEDPVDVESCFSGFAIYRNSSMINPRVFYDMTPDPFNVECEHARFNKKIPGIKLVNPSMINLVLVNT